MEHPWGKIHKTTFPKAYLLYECTLKENKQGEKNMVPVTLLGISIMWIPVALLFLGKGEAKGTGFATALVGGYTIIAGTLHTIINNDPWIGALLVVYGFFYACVAHALLSGLEDLRSVGNVSLTVAIISILYIIFSLTGGPTLGDGTQCIPRCYFLALATFGYFVLYIMVWLNAFGKFPAKTLGVSLIIWTIIGLWLPGFWLLSLNKLPF
jgi:hypothetical protein